MSKALIITADTPYEAVRAAMRNAAPVALAQKLDASELELIVRGMVDRPDSSELAELIVAHPACNHRVCDVLFAMAGKTASVANAIATSGKASVELLRTLSQHTSSSVRGHASLALLKLEIERASVRRLRSLWKAHQGDRGISLGVRHMLATSPRASGRLLRDLARDEADFVASAARAQLAMRRKARQAN